MNGGSWIERMARVGYAAKGVLYATIGVLAARAAVGAQGQATDTRGAMATVLQAPFGRVLLAIIALGLIGYSVWRFVEGFADPDERGADAKGLALRTTFIARGIAHLALAYSAVRLAMGGGGGSQGQQSKHWTAEAFTLPAGTWLVWVVALGLVGYGVYQLYRAVVSKLSKQLNEAQASHDAGRWVIGVSRFGLAARGVVFIAIGILFARAANTRNPNQAGGIADGLRALTELGRWPFAAIAVGLVAYGGYELLNARYRRIRAR